MPRRRRQGHADAAGLIGPLIDRRDRARIVIAARLHDPDRERLILARARRAHRSVRRLAVPVFERGKRAELIRSEEHTSALQSIMRPTYAVLCLTKKKKTNQN